jgi:hypothetical protein
MTIRKLLALFAGAAFIVTTFAGPVDAQGRGRGQSKGKSAAASKSKSKAAKPDKAVTRANPSNAPVVVIFKDADRPKFQTYFTTHKFVAEPLPPGIAMNIARGKPLPPGISTRVLPADLLIYVPRDPNIRYYIVGDRVVAVRNGTIIDVLLNILR